MMKNPPHPGSIVLHECMEPLGLSVTEAAAKLGVSRKQLSAVVNGRSGISAEMAIRLSKAFGGSAEMWVRLQANYNLSRAMERADEIQVERVWPESPAAEPVPA
ncbi:MAG: HigA family addiction module antitoxin [Acidobacteriota bacterium]|nr:HigA family addiction module antitoxin [Acidobacteriota bacterium]MDE3262978.1 HigA family addiction module antitoxin [Acidobacteriota bacterium]MYB31954.1 HigA family addiction module antidote protein [Acidobacteriota bacterium]MYH23376.1 HigA family addiction module antidote protein [Acidobacteriota bacterium]MYK79728.1 HigA family addiction module antidote protein [Acidobacteriota bacterium]